METSKRTSSVIARLMGLDELPLQQPVQKRQRVLSEYYFQRAASIGVRRKHSSHKHPSFRMSIGEHEEFDYIFSILDTLDRHKQHNLSVEDGKASSNSSEEKLGFVRHNQPDAKYISVDKKLRDLAELPDALDITYFKKDFYPKYLQEPDSSFAKNCHDQQGVPSYSRSGNVPVLKSSCTSYGINIDKCRKLGRKALQGNAKLLHKPEKGINRSPRGLGIDGFCKLSRSQLESNSEACHSPTEVILKPNHGKVESDAQHFSSCSSFDGSLLGDTYASGGAKKKISDQWKTNKKVQKDRLDGRVSTLGELLALADDDIGTRNVFYKPSKHGMSNRTGPNDKDGDHLSFISTNVLKDGSMINFSRPTFLSSSSSTGNLRPRARYDGHQSDWHSSREKFVNWAQHESTKQTLHHKDGLEYKISVSNKKNHSVPCLDLESDDTVEKMRVVLDEVKDKLEKDLSNQNCMGPQNSSSTFSYSALENSCFVQDTLAMECEMKNKLDNSNMDEYNILLPQSSVTNVASVSMGANVVADAGCKVVGGASGNSKEEQFEPITCILETNSDSSSSASDSLIRQRASVGFHEEGSVFSQCFHTEPESRLSSEEAYHPSPVSVLELPFEEDLSYSSECLDSISTDICNFSETHSEEPGMIVSSDEDSREGSVGDPQENIGLTGGLFRVEESRSFSYLIDVLTEAGFHGGILSMDFGKWHTSECPLNLSVFETLEKKFGELTSWKRSDRRLLFDQINFGLMEILQPCMGVPKWAKPASKRLSPRPSQDMIEEELWMLLVSQEKEASMDLAAKPLQKELGSVDLGDDIDLIGREIERLLIDELVSEVVSMGTF